MAAPGDQFGAASNAINCRCTLSFDIPADAPWSDLLSGQSAIDQGVSPLSAELDRAVSAYVDDFSGGINAALRDGDTSSPVVGRLDAAIDQQPLSDIRTTWRAMSDDVLSGLSHGDIFRDLGFVSTTAGRDIAEEYASEYAAYHDGRTASLIEMHIPRGSRLLDIERLQDDMAQREILVPRGASWRYEQINGRHVMTLLGAQ
jgi:hypothetical protein